jgi:cell division protein FtsI/penicillin-binding protein 2
MLLTSFTAATRRVIASVVALAAGGGMIAGCMADETPSVTIRSFLLDWENGRYDQAAALTDGDRTTVTNALRDASRQLDAASVHFQLRPMTQNGQTAESGFHASVDLGENGPPWEYDGHIRLRVMGGVWKVVWEPSVVHPRLSDGERFAVVTQVPKRAEIRDDKGRPLVRQTPIAIIGVYPSQLKDPSSTTSQVAALTGLDAGRLLGTVRSAPPKTFTPLVTLQAARYKQIRSRLRAIPGLRVHLGKSPYTAKYAAGLIGSVGTATNETLRRVGAPYQAGDSVGMSGLQVAFQRRLAGTPTTKVITVNRQGDQVEELQTWPGTTSQPITTTIDEKAQYAAEYSLAGLHNVTLVALDASSGQIRAVAARPSVTKRALRGKYSPFTGKYAPGEAFTIVSTDALIGRGINGTDTIPCPDQRTVGGKQFRNSSAGATEVGTTPNFTQVFGTGCDTAFAGLSRKLGDKDLANSAAQYGVGGNWNLPVSTYTGHIPSVESDSDRAAQTLGQGGVLMSPLGMALIGGAVSSGTWRPPQLVTTPQSTRHPENPVSMNPDHMTALRNLMRTAVRSGTLQELNLPGQEIHGQSGATTQDGHQVMTFIGYRKNLALAVVADAPQSAPSNAAVSTAAKFFRTYTDGR